MRPRDRSTRAFAGALLAALLGAGACGPGEPDGLHRALLRDLRAETADADGAGCPGPRGALPAEEPRGVIRDRSRREAVLTCEGVALRTGLELPAGAVLDLSLAPAEEAAEPPPATGPPPEAVVELRRKGRTETLLRVPVGPGAWSEHRLELPEGGEAELVLRSSGRPSVAWAELYLTAGEPRARRPSLILVVLDTLRADHLSLYGYRRPTSPRLDRLGEESLVFERALSSSSWTLPSTATLLSGLLPAQHGAVHVTTRLSPSVPTVAERLRAAGYRTAALTDGGFVGHRWGLAQGFERYDVTPGNAWEPEAKDAERTFREAAGWVRRNRHRPFFLFVHSYETHQPYQNREGFADRFLAPEDRGDPGLSMRVAPHRSGISPEELARMVALYDGEIARADHYLGGFLDVLEEAGLTGEAALVVTSDHGEEFMDHGDLEHAFGKVFDPNVRVPLVVRLPAGAPGAPGSGGRRLEAPVSGIDLAPTLLDLAGLPHDGLPGRSLLDLAAGDGRAAGGRGSRSVLVHGLPSSPNPREIRFRLDRDDRRLILERRLADGAQELLRYDPAARWVEPWPAPEAAGEAEGVSPLLRLAALLAWLEPDGLFARLPDDARGVAVPETSRVRPRALWTGRRWQALDAAAAPASLALDDAGPHFLVFDLAAAGSSRAGAWELLLDRGAGLEPFRLSAERRPPWDPFLDPLPPAGAILPTAAAQRGAGTVTLDADAARELRALGYLE